MGSGLAEIIDFAPFVEAFLVLIVIPLALAWLTQAWGARQRSGRASARAAGMLMVPLMVATLLIVVASQIPKLGGEASAVLGVVPFYIVFLAVMAFLGRRVARLFRLDTAASRAIVFTGATRNSLV